MIYQKRHDKFLHILIFFLVFSLLTACVSIPFLKYRKYGKQYQLVIDKERNIDAESEDSIDVAYIGDSIGWAGFSPLNIYADYGFTSYNCCTSGQLPQEGYLILQHLLNKQNPQVLVVEENLFYSYMIEVRYLINNVWPVLQYHYAYKIRNFSPASNQAKGQNDTSLVVPYSGSTNYMGVSDKKKSFGIANRYYLQKVVDLCKSKDIKIIVIGLPNITWNMEKHNGVQKFCEKYEITYVDYNTGPAKDQMCIDWQTDTRDGGEHLNHGGSSKIANHLGKILKDNCKLPDHRNDSDYSQWNQLAQEAGYDIQESTS